MVARLLRQDIEHVSTLIHGAPEIESLTVDLDHRLIKKPLVAWFGLVSADQIRKQRTEALLPFMDGLVTDVDATIIEDILDIAKAQAETIVQPNSLAWQKPLRRQYQVKQFRRNFRGAPFNPTMKGHHRRRTMRVWETT